MIFGRRHRDKHWSDPPSDASLHLDGVQKRAVEAGHARLVVAGWLFLATFTLIGARMLEIAGTFGGETGAANPRASRPAPTLEISLERADIVDRNGIVMATSLPTVSLYANAQEVLDPKEAAAKLARIWPDIDQAEVQHKLASKRSFVYLRRNLTPKQQYDVNSLGIPGLYFQKGEKRVYPHGTLASHVIGMTDLDNKGIAGVEKTFEAELRRRREPLVLSIDARVQSVLQEELAATIKKFSAVGATGIMMDVNTGEIVAMASLPDFDPNKPSVLAPEAMFNRATLGVYEPGSTFKLFNTAAAIDSGVTTVKGSFDASHPIKISRFEISDYHPENRWLTVSEILMVSSNVGSARMAMAMGIDTQRNYMGRFGMLKPLKLELPEIGAPLVPSPWREINLMTIAYGHGVAVTPLHLANGVTTLVNGGMFRNPTLLRHEGGIATGQQVMKPSTSRDIRTLMRMVVTEGTGAKADVPGYSVGGKTGTAEKLGASGGYRKKSLLSSFIAVFPTTAPRYLVLVMVDEPKGIKETYGYATGGWTAAPAVGRLIARTAPLMGVVPAPDSEPAVKAQMVNAGGRIIAATE
jgi:cell division protein FtsI (penicillin-binding protein 3)